MGMIRRTGRSGYRFDEELRREVVGILDRMPERHRLPLWLCCCLGLGAAGAAEALSLRKEEVEDLLEDGLCELRRLLEARQVRIDSERLGRILASVQPETAPKSVMAGARRRMWSRRPGSPLDEYWGLWAGGDGMIGYN